MKFNQTCTASFYAEVLLVGNSASVLKFFKYEITDRWFICTAACGWINILIYLHNCQTSK